MYLVNPSKMDLENIFQLPWPHLNPFELLPDSSLLVVVVVAPPGCSCPPYLCQAVS